MNNTYKGHMAIYKYIYILVNSSGAFTAQIQFCVLVCPSAYTAMIQSDEGQDLWELVGLLGWAFGLPTGWVLA